MNKLTEFQKHIANKIGYEFPEWKQYAVVASLEGADQEFIIYQIPSPLNPDHCLNIMITRAAVDLQFAKAPAVVMSIGEHQKNGDDFEEFYKNMVRDFLVPLETNQLLCLWHNDDECELVDIELFPELQRKFPNKEVSFWHRPKTSPMEN